VVTTPKRFSTGVIDHAAPRFRKEVLSTGRWMVPYDEEGEIIHRPWQVTRKTLQQIASSFEKAKAAGVRVPVVWGHSDDAKDNAGVVENVFVEGETLLADVRITERQAKSKVGESVNEVSAEITPGWVDGRGNRYEQMMTHLGLVNLPVISGQTPFHRLSLVRSSQPMAKKVVAQKVHRLQTEGEGEPGDAETMMSVPDICELMRTHFGAKIPADVDTVKELRIVMEMMGGAPSEESPAEETSEMASEVVEGLDLAPADVAQLKGKQNAEVVRLRKQLATMQAERVSDAKAAFVERLDTLMEAGQIMPADREGLMEAGKVAAWRLSLLVPLERREARKDGDGVIRRLATGKPPTVGSHEANQQAIAERQAEIERRQDARRASTAAG
jgi:hypothetical protein